MIGCVAIAFPVFFPPDEWVAVPSDWSRNIVSGRSYDLSRGEGYRLLQECFERAVATAGAAWDEAIDAHRQGKEQLIRPRLGQASFRLAVFEAYGNACAVTTEHSLPALEAAHIKPWSVGGAHEVRNGLPLRRDRHRLFDLGFVTVKTGSHLRRESAAKGHLRERPDLLRARRPEDPCPCRRLCPPRARVSGVAQPRGVPDELSRR